MLVLRDSRRGIVPATVVYVYTHLMQSVPFSMNSCLQFKGYQTVTIVQWSSNKSTHLPWRTENNASKPLFSVLTDG